MWPADFTSVFDIIVRTVMDILSGVMGMFPAYSLPGTVTQLGSSVGSAVAAANGVFPVVTLGVCIAVAISARLFIAAWAGIAWVYNKIPAKFT